MPIPIPQSALPLHRIRFFDHTPSPITALAFAPLPLPPARDPSVPLEKGKGRSTDSQEVENEQGVLIVARENGEVEVWGYVPSIDRGMGNWVLEKVLPPTLTHPGISLMALTIRDPTNFHLKPYAVPKLTDLRLFTAGADSADITERCLLTGRILSAYPVPSPPLWSLTVSPTHTLLCLTTTSSALHFLSIPADSPLEPPPPNLLRSDALPSRTRTVSVAWGPPRLVQEGEEWEWRETYLITGNSDSSFRKWEISPPDPNRPGAGRVGLRGRAVVEKVGKYKGGKKGSAKGTIVWGVGVLPDHSIVTSDSLGSVTFWDGASLAQKQSFQAHKADGMCMVIGPTGRTVFTSGPDQRVCQFTLSSSARPEWHLTYTKRMHSHDVRALAIFPPYRSMPSSLLQQRSSLNPFLAPVLASGGWDMSLVLTPAASPEINVDRVRNPLGKANTMSRVIFEESYARKMSYLGGGRGTGRVTISRGARLLLGMKDRSVGIWRVRDEEQGWEKTVEMELQLRTNLISAAISSDGRFVAVSDLYETKLFRLAPSSGGSLQPVRLRNFLPALLESPLLSHLDLRARGTGSSALLFTPDNSRLILGLAGSGHLAVVRLLGGRIEIEKCFTRQELVMGGRVVKGVRGRRGIDELNGGTDGVGGNKANGAKKAKNGDQRADRELTCRAAREQAGEQSQRAQVNGFVNGHGHLLNGCLPNGSSSKAFEGADDHSEPQGLQQSGSAAETHTNVNGSFSALADADMDSGDDTDDDDNDDGGDAKNMILPRVATEVSWVCSLAASDDGQWLAASDVSGRIALFNLDLLQTHATLPTFPNAPSALLFPSAQSLLLTIVLPDHSLQFYHIEQRKLLPPTPQIVALNKVLKAQYIPLQSACFEPTRANSRAAKLVIWSHEWMATARIDLDLVARVRLDEMQGGQQSRASVRRKRAREARDALDALTASTPTTADPDQPASSDIGTPNPFPASASTAGSRIHSGSGSVTGSVQSQGKGVSSADDPDFVKVSPYRFQAVALVDWLGEGELCVVERPFADFAGELPKAFWSGSFGRS